MDLQQPQQPISDDQELAKVLAGITASADQTDAAADLADDLSQEAQADEVPVPDPVVPEPAVEEATDIAMPAPVPEPVFEPVQDGNLESIKTSAINELRPLVDKLNLSPEEKFDTYLLIIRSTDDASLVGPAFEAARGILDETAKAQALLDIVKEIDYLSPPQEQAV